MSQVDFTNSEASEAIFDQCDLSAAIFSNTILQKADFSSALNFSIDPEANVLKNATFSKDNLAGLLTKYRISIH